MIRESILAGGIIYISIAALQVIDRPSMLGEGIVVMSALAFATAFYLTRNEHALHRWEMAALWTTVLLFALYGFLKFWGVI
jgi:hypothetical protein